MANLEMQRQFIQAGGEKIKKAPKRSKGLEKGTRKRSKPLRGSSDKQQARTETLTGIMAERIHRATSEHGFFHCECGFADCRRRWADPQFALNECDPHHLERRKGKRAATRAAVFGSDDAPDKVIVVSKVCHRRLESAPEFSRESA